MKVVVVSVVTWRRGWRRRGGDSGRAVEMAAGGDVCRGSGVVEVRGLRRDGDEIKTMRVVVLYRGGVGDVVFRWWCSRRPSPESRRNLSEKGERRQRGEEGGSVC
ncbi:hypothetical protein Tco_0564086 [Tanacetum coccineum]